MNQCQYDIFINQGKYIKEFLKEYGLNSSKHAKIPTSLSYKLDNCYGLE